MRIMKYNTWLKSLTINESRKNDFLNSILDKISKKMNITDSEKNFLDKFDDIVEDDIKDKNFLSNDDAFLEIDKILDSKKMIICNLSDRDGKLGHKISNISRDYKNDKIILTFDNNKEFILKDNFLYNIKYILDNNNYSLESQDEYFEKIPLKNED